MTLPTFRLRQSKRKVMSGRGINTTLTRTSRMRELDEHEFNWDASEVNIVGADAPMRIVSLQLHNDEWHVEGAETGGPNYHRPGFTELISSEFADTFSDADNAFNAVHDYIERLS